MNTDANSPARGPRPHRGRLRDRARQRALRVGTLALVVLVSAACTSAANAHEEQYTHEEHDNHDQHGGEDTSPQPAEQDGGGNQQAGDGNADLNGDEQVLLQLVLGIQFAGDVVNGNRTLGQDCSVSDLPRHDGFEADQAVCVETAAGEQPAFDQGPQLLIVDFPREVRTGEPFSYLISTRNLVRARFLGAGDGGYYAESSFLDNEGLTLGHFHTGCRQLSHGLGAAPQAEVLPDFFQAVEDFRGGAEADFVEIQVDEGLPEPGLYQCAAWAGDASHRIPMMARAQQFPAFDAVRLVVW